MGGWGSIHSNLHSSSALYYLLNQQFTSLQQVFGHVGRHSDYMFRRFGDLNSPGSREFQRILFEFIDTCRSRHIPLGMVLFPGTQFRIDGSYPYDFLHEQVLDICQQKGILCVDLRGAFKPFYHRPGVSSLWVNRFDSHPSGFANRLAASRILESFNPIWLEGV